MAEPLIPMRTVARHPFPGSGPAAPSWPDLLNIVKATPGGRGMLAIRPGDADRIRAEQPDRPVDPVQRAALDLTGVPFMVAIDVPPGTVEVRIPDAEALAAFLKAQGEPVAEPLIDPDCRSGKHTTCVGGPCECPCHAPTKEG